MGKTDVDIPRSMDTDGDGLSRCHVCRGTETWLKCKVTKQDLCYDCAGACGVCQIWPLSPAFVPSWDHRCEPPGLPEILIGDEVLNGLTPPQSSSPGQGDSAAGPARGNVADENFADALRLRLLVLRQLRETFYNAAAVTVLPLSTPIQAVQTALPGDFNDSETDSEMPALVLSSTESDAPSTIADDQLCNLCGQPWRTHICRQPWRPRRLRGYAFSISPQVASETLARGIDHAHGNQNYSAQSSEGATSSSAAKAAPKPKRRILKGRRRLQGSESTYDSDSDEPAVDPQPPPNCRYHYPVQSPNPCDHIDLLEMD